MAQTMSSPAKIKDIYKKLVFINRDLDGSGYLMDTDAGTADDTELSIIHNDFNLAGNLVFSGTLHGTDFTQAKDIDEVLTALYGKHIGQTSQDVPFYYADGQAMGAAGALIDDPDLQALAGKSLPEDLVLEMNERYDNCETLQSYIDVIKVSVGLESDYTWDQPPWNRIDLNNDDITEDITPLDISHAVSLVDDKLKLDLDWLRGMQKKFDSGILTGGGFGGDDHIASNLNTFQEAYLSPFLTNSHYLGGSSGYLADATGHPTVNNITPTIGDFLSAVLVLDDRVYNREQEINALDTRLNISTTTNPDGTSNVSVWDGITFHGDEVSNAANEIDFEASETNLANQTTEAAPNLGDALNMLIDRDENIYGMMNKRLDGTDTYTAATTAENLQEAFNRIGHIDDALSNIRLYAFGSDDENAYVSANPQGAAPAGYADLTNQLAGGTYSTSAYLENNIILIDSKLSNVETFLTGGTNVTGSPNQTFSTIVNASGDGTNNTLESTINKMCDWFSQFATINDPGGNQPKTLINYSFDDDVIIESGSGLTMPSGDIAVTSGNLVLTSGLISASGNITTLEGSINATAGAIECYGTITSNTGDVVSLFGDVTAAAAVTAGTYITATSNLNMLAGTANLDGILDVSGQVDFHGGLDMNTNDITGLPTDAGASADKAASVGYVQLVAAGRLWDAAVNAVSNTDEDLAIPSQPMDGVTLTNGMRVCLINQTDAEENGVYEVNASIDLVRPSSGPWETAQANNLQANTSVFVKAGTTYIDTVFTVSNEDPAYTVDTDDLTLHQTDALQAWTTGNVTYTDNNTMNISGGNGIDANSGWTYGQANGSLSIDLDASNPGLEFNGGKLRAKADGTWIDRSASGLTFDSAKGTQHTHSYDITDSMAPAFWNDAPSVALVEGIDQDISNGASPTFTTVTAALSGNATTSSGCSGNSATATALATGRDFALTGFVTGSAAGFDGTGNLSIATTLGGNIADGNIVSAPDWNAIESQVNTDSGDWDNAYTHSNVTSGNPHSVTQSNVGLGNVDDTSDALKPVSTATATALADKVSLLTSAPDNAQQVINSPLKVNQGDTAYTEFINNYAIGQESAIMVSAPVTPNGGTNCDNALFVASTRDALGTQGFAGVFFETTDNWASDKSWAILAKDNTGNSLGFYRQVDGQSGDMESLNLNIAMKISNDGEVKCYDGLVVQSHITGTAITDTTPANGGGLIPTENSVFDFVHGHVGSTAFTLEDTYGSVADGVTNKVPTVNCLYDYVENNSPATGVTSLGVAGGSGLSVDTSTGAVTIDWTDPGGGAQDAWLNNDDTVDGYSTNYDWAVGSSASNQYQVFRANGSNGNIEIDYSNASDSCGTWRLLVEYQNSGGQKYIQSDNSSGPSMYTLFGGAQLSPPSGEREADLLVFTKFPGNRSTLTVVAPLMNLDN